MDTTQLLLARELTNEEIDHVSGGNPVLAGRVAMAVVGYIGGKIIDGVVGDSGILDPVVKFTGGKIIVGGKSFG